MDLDEIDENLTPQPKSAKIETSKIETPKREMAPPPVANVQLRAKLTKKINRSTSAWKSLSLSRRDKVKNDASQIFRSPSIYENNSNDDKDDEPIMTKYLSGKICPLTPSQQPTNIDHLVEQNPGVKSENKEEIPKDDHTNHAIVPASPSLTIAGQPMANYCSIM